MTDTDAKRLATRYADRLHAIEDGGAVAVQMDLDTQCDCASAGTIRSHVAWMLGEIPSLLDDGARDKAMRWLGWAQAALWFLGIIETVADGMKDVNEPPPYFPETCDDCPMMYCRPRDFSGTAPPEDCPRRRAGGDK